MKKKAVLNSLNSELSVFSVPFSSLQIYTVYNSKSLHEPGTKCLIYWHVDCDIFPSPGEIGVIRSSHQTLISKSMSTILTLHTPLTKLKFATYPAIHIRSTAFRLDPMRLLMICKFAIPRGSQCVC